MIDLFIEQIRDDKTEIQWLESIVEHLRSEVAAHRQAHQETAQELVLANERCNDVAQLKIALDAEVDQLKGELRIAWEEDPLVPELREKVKGLEIRVEEQRDRIKADCIAASEREKECARLTTENERLLARIDSEFTHDQLLHEVSSYRSGMMAAEASLADAAALLPTAEQLRADKRISIEAKRCLADLVDFLANQPATPCACEHPEDAGTHGLTMCEIDDDEPNAPVYYDEYDTGGRKMMCQPAAQSRFQGWPPFDQPSTAAQSTSELMARVHAPLPGWDNIERKTAARCSHCASPDGHCPHHRPDAWKTQPIGQTAAPTRTEAQLDSAIAAVKSYREVVARTEAEQAVLDRSKDVAEGALRWLLKGSVSVDLMDWAAAELARRGLK